MLSATTDPEAARLRCPPGRPDRVGNSRLRLALIAGDVLAVTCAWVAVGMWPGSQLGIGGAIAHAAIIVLVTLVAVRAEGLYLSRVCSLRTVEATRLLRAAGAGALAALLLQAGGPRRAVAEAVIGGGGTFILLVCTRGFYDAWLRAERAVGRFSRPVAVVGQGVAARRVLDLLDHHPQLGYQVTGLLGDRRTALEAGVPWLGDLDRGVDAVVAAGARGVVLAAEGSPGGTIETLVRDLLARGLHVQVSAGLWRISHRRLRAAPLAHVPFFYLEPGLSPAQLRIKRGMDLLLAVPMTVLVTPLLLGAAIAVKLGDGGPVLFRQERVGRDGRPFKVLKFRTMTVNAEAAVGALAQHNEREGPLFKLADDPRVTRVGRILRASSLDELPQLFNVIAGSMSLVGPRPALPAEVAAFDEDLRGRHAVPPGVTGLWQVESRDNASFEAYRHLDLFYAENWSPALDLVVIAATIPTIVARAVRSGRPARPRLKTL